MKNNSRDDTEIILKYAIGVMLFIVIITTIILIKLSAKQNNNKYNNEPIRICSFIEETPIEISE